MGELLKSISQNPDLIAEFTAEQIAEARAELEALSAAIKAGEVPAGSDEIAEAVALAGKLTEREDALLADEARKVEEIAALDAALGITSEEVEEIVAEEAGPEDEDEEERGGGEGRSRGCIRSHPRRDRQTRSPVQQAGRPRRPRSSGRFRRNAHGGSPHRILLRGTRHERVAVGPR